MGPDPFFGCRTASWKLAATPHYPSSLWILTGHQRHILSAKAETVAQNVADALFSGNIRDVIEVTLGIRGLVIDRRRQNPAPHRHHADNEFSRPGRGDQVAHHALAAADRHLVGVRAENLLDRQGFHLV